MGKPNSVQKQSQETKWPGLLHDHQTLAIDVKVKHGLAAKIDSKNLLFKD